MKNQEVGIYNWNGVLKKWRATLIANEKPILIGQFDKYTEAVKAIEKRASEKPRAILITSPKKAPRLF